MGKLYIKDSGIWKQVQQLWVKQSGSWQSVSSGVITNSGMLGQFYPDTIPPVTYAVPGTYSYTVPAGVTQISALIVGGGGGGGGQYFNGSIAVSGGGGGSGGVVNTVVSVTPGQVLTVVVGAGGNGQGYNGTSAGSAGGSSSFGGNTATGGGLGAIYNGSTSSPPGGVAGSPNGVAGSSGSFPSYNGGAGGSNSSSYGRGGNGGGGTGLGYLGWNGAPGGAGCVSLRAAGQVVFGDTTVNRNDAPRSGSAYSWVVPAGVTSVSINAAGGGGGAFAYHDGGYCQHAWAGGPGGGLANLVLSVTAGDVISGVYGNAGGASSYSGVRGGDGSATTIFKNGSLVATCGAGGNATDARPPAVGTTTVTAGYSGTPTTGTVQTGWVSGCDGGYPPEDHYDPWSWVLGGSASYPQSVLGTVAIQAPSALGANFGRAGMPQVCGWVSITW